MTFPYKWFLSAFASAGDVTAIPNTAPGDGSISYPTGYGPDYQLDPATNPSALDIDRRTMNQLFLDITTVLQYLESGLIVAWIDATTNGGTSFSYAKGAICLYTDGRLYESLVVTNTTTPGTDPTKWALWGTVGVQAQAANFGTDTGAANAYVITTTPAVPALTNGLPIRWTPTHANTGASTANVSGLGAVAIVHNDGSALNANDLPVNGGVEMWYNASLGKFILSTATAVLPTYTFITATGTYTTPAGARQLEVRAVGAGGGSAGSGSGSNGAGGAGGDTIFNGIHAAGGGPGGSTGNGGTGGTGGAGSATARFRGQPGVPGQATAAGLGGTLNSTGAPGGASMLAGGGEADNNAPANTGAGAGGVSQSSLANGISGASGGGGEGIFLVINSPGATYGATIGVGGSGGSAGTGGNAGHTGGSGWIIVKEIYG